MVIQPPQKSHLISFMESALHKSVIHSYAVVAVSLALAAWLHLGTLLVTVLFGYFALNKLNFLNRKWLAVALFSILLVAAFFGFGLFVKRAIKELPEIAEKVIPAVVQYAKGHNVTLPISDFDELMEAAPKMMSQSAGPLGSFAKLTIKEFVMLVVGVVIAIGLFVQREATQITGNGENLYTHYYGLIRSRFHAFYLSFETVMGAQLLISLVNTGATAVYLLSSSMRPYAGILIPLTFICGMLPIIGNLISNTLIVGIAFGAISPQAALWALVFLVVVHKMEYFLNSKIIGGRIQHPMWLTLIALILGESLMGIPGVILAPVILSYIKVEGSRYALPGNTPAGV